MSQVSLSEILSIKLIKFDPKVPSIGAKQLLMQDDVRSRVTQSSQGSIGLNADHNP